METLTACVTRTELLRLRGLYGTRFLFNERGRSFSHETRVMDGQPLCEKDALEVGNEVLVFPIGSMQVTSFPLDTERRALKTLPKFKGHPEETW